MSRIVFVGGGPKTTGLLFALAAHARADRTAFPPAVEIVVIDPFPPGGGRIWRHDQARVLWMNSLAEDVTIFPDADASVPHPPITGPSLAEWAGSRDLTHLGAPARGLRAGDFAPRRVQSAYLAWAFDRAVESLPDGFTVMAVRGLAVAAEARGEKHLVRYAKNAPGNLATAPTRVDPVTGATGGGAAPTARRTESVVADVLVLAQGFLEVEPDEETHTLLSSADEHGLGYIAPGYTADIDLSTVPAGENVLVRGMGLAFIDAMMLLTESRGGVFEGTPDGSIDGPLIYRPSGREPTLWVGSRRGVPYKSKLGYRPEGLAIGPTRWLTDDTVRGLVRDDGTVSADDVLFPLLEAELATAHYVELATRYTGRTTATAQDFLEHFAAWHSAFASGDTADAAVKREEWVRFAEATVPDPQDRFDLSHLDRPFADALFGSREEFDHAVAAHTRAEIDRAANPSFSQDSAVFFALVSAYYVTRGLVAAGLFTPSDRSRKIDGRLHGLFSYIASGPPPERLENLLALHRAGIVRFLGADVRVGVDPECPAFVATSAVHPDTVRTRWLIDARLAPVSAARATDPLLRGLVEGGQLLLETDGGDAAKLIADARGRAVAPDGKAHTGLFLVGPSVAASTPEAFTRPGIDARVFPDNARIADELRQVLRIRDRDAVHL
ncbi:FAD/NAD(P)-binding protein [Brevibacterium yomogidense]|uniref:FAD/NAD(P)-binding protein n=1 Tax=Brevibacterium yomogidense TaxID=946573 RepID=UPI0018DFB438|nr:FAD/NAD(P)-binding protein [Brevibacterium yomogidense]